MFFGFCIAFVRTIGYNIRKNILWKEFNVMASKTANLYARIEPDVKEQAENILSALGIPVSGAINMFYKQIAGPLPELLKKNFQRPTSFINQLDKKQEKADIVIIDEAHLLLSKPAHYNNFYHDNQLVRSLVKIKFKLI